MTVRAKRKLSEGGYAFVFLAEDLETGTACVVKKILLTTPHARQSASIELSILRKISHPNIIELLSGLITTSESLLVLEYCPGGSLLDLLQKTQAQGDHQLGEPTALRIFNDVALAVRYLHKEGVVHRDLKLENILRTTTQMYRAPEMADLFMTKELTCMVDIWALGCILYALCFLRHPFETSSNLAIINSKIKFPQPIPSSDNIQEFILRMLTADPSCRATADEVIACTKALVLGHPLPARTFRKPQWDVGDESLSPPQLGPTKEKCGVGKEKALKQIARAELDPSSVAAQRLRKRKETNKIEDGQFNQRVPDSSLLLLSRDENEDGGMYFLPPPSWTANDTKAFACTASDSSTMFPKAAASAQSFEDYKVVKNLWPEVHGATLGNSPEMMHHHHGQPCESIPNTPSRQRDPVPPRMLQSEGIQMHVKTRRQLSPGSFHHSSTFQPLQQQPSYFEPAERGMVIPTRAHHEMVPEQQREEARNNPCNPYMRPSELQIGYSPYETKLHGRNCLDHANITPEPVRHGSVVLPAQQRSSMPAQSGPLQGQPEFRSDQRGSLLQAQQRNSIAIVPPDTLQSHFGGSTTTCGLLHVPTDDLCSSNTPREDRRSRPVSLPLNFFPQPTIVSSLPHGGQVTCSNPNSSRAACISMMNETVTCQRAEDKTISRSVPRDRVQWKGGSKMW